jgi:hypothetical protein
MTAYSILLLFFTLDFFELLLKSQTSRFEMLYFLQLKLFREI